MSRLYVVEQSGLEPGGHYYSYTSCVVAGAREAGLEPVILANKRFRPPPPPHALAEKQKGAGASGDGIEIVPAFTYTWGEAELHGSLRWGDGNLAYEMFEAFRRVPPVPDDHVFLHTFGYRELLALLLALASKLPGEPIPYFHLLLRRDPDQLIENYREYADYFSLLAASAWLRQKVLLHTDTQLLSAAFAKICGLPFRTAPIPFDQGLLRAALGARRPRRNGAPLTIAYLGDAREEKGYRHLPAALSHLWQDYVATGRARFVLQSNYNTPGGEPGVLAASQVLAGFPATTLLTEPLAPAEYYRVLAEADIVLIPYSPQRYRYRSSGVLIEAMAAGKVVVTSADSWMATQVGPDHSVLFETPAGLGPAIGAAVDRYDELSAGAQARSEATLAGATGANLVRHLVEAARPTAVPARRGRVLLVMNGDAIVLRNGASRIAHAQLQYLTAAGYEIVGLFLTYNSPATSEAFAAWRLALARSIAPYPLVGVFVAGPGRWGSEAEQSPAVRDQRQSGGAPLRGEFDFVASFEFGGKVMQFLRAHPIDAILLNYITNYPVIEALGLTDVPVICEMHDLQSFQRAIYGHRLVEEDDLAEEFSWLARCAALLSLNPRETAIVRARLPKVQVETTGVFLPSPSPALPNLAGARDLAEIVSSAGPLLTEYQAEALLVAKQELAAAPESDAALALAGFAAQLRLAEIDSLDLLYVSSAHMANVSGLKWFLSEVYQPYLAHHRVSMIVAGSICRIGGWPAHPRVFFIDQVEDLAPLYAVARVVVLPITEGAGSPVKTYEALAYGRPVIGTSHAFRGLDGDAGEFMVRDDPRDFADAVLDLVNSAEERREASQRSLRTAAKCNDFARYFGVMDRVFAAVRRGKSAATPAPATAAPEPQTLEFSPPLRALNRTLRSYLDGEPLEGASLDVLANEDPSEVERLLESVARSLLEDRNAAVLQTEQRLKRYLANPLRSRLRDNATAAVRLAIAERRGAAPGGGTPGGGISFVAFAGLPLSVAGGAGAPGMSLEVDGRNIRSRRLAGAILHGGRAQLFQAEISPPEDAYLGLRAIEIVTSAEDGDEAPEILVLRQSVPLTAGLRLLGREVFGGGFEIRAAGDGAELAPGSVGQLTLPRIADGNGVAYVDLCLAGLDEATDADAMSPVSVTVNRRPAELEVIGGGEPTIVRIILADPAAIGDFGVVPLTVANRRQAALRLVAAHTGLMRRHDADTAEIATALTFASERAEQASQPRLARLAREAIALILRGEPPPGSALNALCTLAGGLDRDEAIGKLLTQEFARLARLNGSAGTPFGAAAALADLRAIVASCLGTGDAAATIFCPGLPFAVVDDWGQAMPAQTEAALRRRGNSWLLPPAPGGRGERICIQFDATFDIPDHPGLIGFSNFHPAESADDPFRWTGPGRASTITIPLALNRSARLVIELGSTGRNRAGSDFTLSCNGRPVACSAETEGGRIARISAELPPARIAGIATEIAIAIRECFQQPPDERQLGIVVRLISLYLDPPGEAPAASVSAGPERAQQPRAPELSAGAAGSRRRRSAKPPAARPSA